MHDNGGAPCVQNGLLTLAICKPAIRRTAKVGDLIFAFGGVTTIYPRRLIFACQVTEKTKIGAYYQEKKFQKRRDCIYECIGDPGQIENYRYKVGSLYHRDQPSMRNKDIGSTGKNAITIISKKFVYFGKIATDKFLKENKYTNSLFGNLSQGHRVKHDKVVFDELTAAWLSLQKNPRFGKNGIPNLKGNPCGEDVCE